MRPPFGKLCVKAFLAGLLGTAFGPSAFCDTDTSQDYLTHLQVNLTSFAGNGQAEGAGHMRQASGIDISLGKPFQLSHRWLIGPVLHATDQAARLSDDLDSGAHLGTAIQMRSVAAGGTLGYIAPIHTERLPVVFLRGTFGRVYGKATADRSETDYYAQAHYDNLTGQVQTSTLGLLLPLSEAFHIELAGSLIHYRLPLNGALSSTDVEEQKEGTTLRFTKEEDPAATGLPDTLSMRARVLSLGVGLTIN